ncbi:MAG: superinfection exclusion B family protein [Fibromonadaceae bacterium]|jgi:hypothetical protein|nr:superinfection exclusion B family protein [Fibromonadaceae bacterium]
MEKDKIISTILKNILPEIKEYFPYLIFILWASSLICVFLPECYLEKLYLKEFREERKEWFGMSFIVLSASIFVIVSFDRWELFKINKTIKNMDFPELNILYQYFYKTNINTMSLSKNTPTVSCLEYRGIILKILTGTDKAYYSINPYYKKALFKRLKKEANNIENMNVLASKEE